MNKIIERNTTIPARKSQVYSTASDNQSSVSIHVLQGEREMASDNRTLGQFELVGIPPSPRGVPQIEVTFNIDANGILNVSAKDSGTGKEQSIRITPSSGLSEEEIKNMQRDAESHADEDKKKKDRIDAKNQADSLVYTTEKALKEYGDKVDAGTKAKIEEKLEALRRVQSGEDPEAVKKAIEELNSETMKLGEAMYKAHEPIHPPTDMPTEETGQASSRQKKAEDRYADAVDAEYTPANKN
jgi:molecular chaperone DnaK